ncbi:beta-lactoglobulin-like [Sturnira hondurensis]|uniref:beta-lactoglobulin-like n=1 Tax=Sturnira hondurensis TaxID=192404 RepID=UPI00187A7BE2|nr:beta-lactoglobulin-like [Sturnira hondurensis]
MRCLLLAVTVALACGTQDVFVFQTRKNLDVQKVAGAWYPMAMGASAAAQLNTQSIPVRLFIKDLRPPAQDGLEITMSRWEDGRCVERKMFAEKTAAPASFQIKNQEGNKAAPVPDQEEGNKAPVPDQEEGNVASAAALEGAKVHVLDTDYKNFLFLCVEAAAAPAKQSLACQYLARTPKADKAVMEQFKRAVSEFSMHSSITFIPIQAEERCRV